MIHYKIYPLSEQNEVSGLRLNFSTMERSCRKCMVSRTDLRRAENYSDIHAKHHESRTNQSLKEDYAEAVEKRVMNINGILHFTYTSCNNYHKKIKVIYRISFKEVPPLLGKRSIS